MSEQAEARDMTRSFVSTVRALVRVEAERDAALAAGRAVEEQLDRANHAITRVLVLCAEADEALPLSMIRTRDIRAALAGKP